MLVLLPATVATAEQPTLRIWSSPGRLVNERWESGCKECDAFWNDYGHDLDFRAKINARFTVYYVNVNHPENKTPLKDDRIQQLPTFAGQGVHVSGYRGKAWLLAEMARQDLRPVDRPSSKITKSSNDDLAHLPIYGYTKPRPTAPTNAPKRPDDLTNRVAELAKDVAKIQISINALQARQSEINWKLSELAAKLAAIKSPPELTDADPADTLHAPPPKRRPRP